MGEVGGRRRAGVIYARVSKDSVDGVSIDAQLTRCRDAAESEGVDVVAEYVDRGASGGRARDNAAKALADLREGRASVLVTWSVDRWGRRGLRDLVDLVDVVDQVPGVLVVFVGDGLRSDGPDWDLRVGLGAVLARTELARISKRNKDAAARMREEPRWSGGPTPYGYDVVPREDGPGKVLRVRANEAEVLRGCAARVLAGEAVLAIVRDLNARSVLAPGAARAKKSGRATTSRETWTTSALRRVLMSHTMRGHQLDGEGRVRRGEDGEPVEFWAPILDAVTWHRVRGVLGGDRITEKNETTGPVPFRGRPPSSILSGVARCGECGAAMYCKRNGARYADGGMVAFLQCPNASRGRCRGAAVREASLAEYVAGEFLRVRGQMPRLAARTVDSVDVARLADIEGAVRETVNEMARAFTPELGEFLAGLQRERERLRGEVSSAGPSVVWEDSGETWGEVWERADVVGRRDILAANLDVTVRWAPRGKARQDIAGRTHIYWRPVRVVGALDDVAPLGLRVTGDDLGDLAEWDELGHEDVR